MTPSLIVSILAGCTCNPETSVDTVSPTAAATDSATPPRSALPRIPSELTGTLVDVAISNTHQCALRDDGTLACWGATPPPLFDNYRFIDIDASPHQLCGITAKLDVVCFAGTPDPVSTTVSTLSQQGTLQRFSAGASLGDWCALVDGSVRCDFVDFEDGGFAGTVRGAGQACAWKHGEAPTCYEMDTTTKYGNGDTGTQETSLFPGNLPMRDGVLYPRICAVSASGAVNCMTNEFQSVLGPASYADFVKVWTGPAHACALTASGQVACWGAKGRVESPVGDGFSVVSMARTTACGVRMGRVECWPL